MRKTYGQNEESPMPRVAPRTYKKNTKDGEFRIFFVFSRCNLGCGILHLSRKFFVFPGFRVFWAAKQNHKVGVCSLMLQKHVLCVSLLRRWWGSCGQHVQAIIRGAMQQMLGGGGTNLRLLAEAGCQAPATLGTRKTGTVSSLSCTV